MNVLNLVTNPEASFFEHQVATLEKLGVDSTTVAVTGQRHLNQDDGGRSPMEYLRLFPRVLRHARGDYDLVHANYGLMGPAALAQPHRPIVLSLWGSDLHGPVGALSRLCARRVDEVIVMSDRMANTLDPIDSHVIPHGIDLGRFRPLPRRAAREEIGWPSSGRHVLFPYTQTRPVKDYPRAVSVVEAVRERVDVTVTLQSPSNVPHDAMPLYLNAADALLLTSKREGSPNTVKEAMACNLPVVSTDVGDVRERLANVSNSVVGRTDEELVDGLEAVLERDTPSDGRRHAQSLGLERMGERILEVYESAIERRTESGVTALFRSRSAVGEE